MSLKAKTYLFLPPVLPAALSLVKAKGNSVIQNAENMFAELELHLHRYTVHFIISEERQISNFLLLFWNIRMKPNVTLNRK